MGYKMKKKDIACKWVSMKGFISARQVKKVFLEIANSIGEGDEKPLRDFFKEIEEMQK